MATCKDSHYHGNTSALTSVPIETHQYDVAMVIQFVTPDMKLQWNHVSCWLCQAGAILASQSYSIAVAMVTPQLHCAPFHLQRGPQSQSGAIADDTHESFVWDL